MRIKITVWWQNKKRPQIGYHRSTGRRKDAVPPVFPQKRALYTAPICTDLHRFASFCIVLHGVRYAAVTGSPVGGYKKFHDRCSGATSNGAPSAPLSALRHSLWDAFHFTAPRRSIFKRYLILFIITRSSAVVNSFFQKRGQNSRKKYRPFKKVCTLFTSCTQKTVDKVSSVVYNSIRRLKNFIPTFGSLQ